MSIVDFIRSVIMPGQQQQLRKKPVIVTITLHMPTCEICGKESKTMIQHYKHQVACETAAQEEVARERAKRLASVAQGEECENCGRVHVFGCEADRCEREFLAHQIRQLDELSEREERMKYGI